MKNTQSKRKPIKIRKERGATFYLVCKDFTHDFKLQEVKTTNEILREKSHCLSIQSVKIFKTKT